jgi:hypothetical protein
MSESFLFRFLNQITGISGRRVVRLEHVDIFLRPVLPSMGNQTSFAVAVLNRKANFKCRRCYEDNVQFSLQTSTFPWIN